MDANAGQVIYNGGSEVKIPKMSVQGLGDYDRDNGYQQGGVTVVCAFDEKAIENGPFAGVEGVGEKGYPYFRNRCFIMARAGTDEAAVTELKELYDAILADEEMVSWLQDTMLLEVDPMTQEDVDAHVENVKNIVNEYKDIVVG